MDPTQASTDKSSPQEESKCNSRNQGVEPPPADLKIALFEKESVKL